MSALANEHATPGPQAGPSPDKSGLPATIPEYLAALRAALADADPAMIQDALYDAEDYLRSEMAAQPGKSEAEVIAEVAGSYGAPDEVADIYRQAEVTVNRALRTPAPPKRTSWVGRFFGIAADPHTYGALFYMLLSLGTGIVYFTWTVVGLSLSLGLLILIVGVPLLLLFLASTRLLSLVEGRIVETLLGVRMPRRPLYSQRDKPWLKRIGEMFTDGRTWTTMLYFLLMLPLGTAYFSIAVTLLATGVGLSAAVLGFFFPDRFNIMFVDWNVTTDAPWMLPLWTAAGIVLLFATLHLARAIGRLHGWLAKHLLVRDPVV